MHVYARHFSGGNGYNQTCNYYLCLTGMVDSNRRLTHMANLANPVKKLDLTHLFNGC